MKTTSFIQKLTTFALAALLFPSLSGMAGIVTTSSTTPTIGTGDIGNLTWVGTNSDKFWADATNIGQAFTTGSAAGYKLLSFSSPSKNAGSPGGTRNYNLRVVSIAGSNTTTLATEAFTHNTPYAADDWFTWALTTPVLLSANTLYGVDVEHVSGGDWHSGIPYMKYNKQDDVAGSFRYTRGDGDPSTINASTGYDRLFYVDLAQIPNVVWDDGAATGIWNTADLNWGGGSAWSQNDGAVFATTGAGTVTLGSAVNAFSLTFNDNGYDIAQDGGGLYDLTVGTGVSVAGAVSATISAPLAGTSGLTKSGDGTLVLTGTNTYTGGTTVGAGTLEVGDGTTDGTLGGGDVSNSGVLAFNNVGLQTVSANITGTGSVTKAGAGTLTLTGTNDYAGGTTISGGKISVGGDGHLGTGGAAIGSGAELEYTGSTTIGQNIVNDGTLTLSGGTTTVTSNITTTGGGVTNTSGTLVVNGSLGGATTITGGTLKGSGFLDSVTVNAGTLAPGNSIDTITVGDLTLSGNYEWEVDATSSDLTIVTSALGTGNLDISGDVVIDITPLSGAYFSSGQVFTLFTYDGALTTDGLTNDLSVTYGGDAAKWLVQGATFADTGAAITLTGIEYIPEPSTIILAGLGLLGVTFRRRRSA